MPKTGEICQVSGNYRWSGHSDGSISCGVTHEEYIIPMKRGDPFPPTRHCGKGAFWTLIY